MRVFYIKYVMKKKDLRLKLSSIINIRRVVKEKVKYIVFMFLIFTNVIYLKI